MCHFYEILVLSPQCIWLVSTFIDIWRKNRRLMKSCPHTVQVTRVDQLPESDNECKRTIGAVIRYVWHGDSRTVYRSERHMNDKRTQDPTHIHTYVHACTIHTGPVYSDHIWTHLTVAKAKDTEHKGTAGGISVSICLGHGRSARRSIQNGRLYDPTFKCNTFIPH